VGNNVFSEAFKLRVRFVTQSMIDVIGYHQAAVMQAARNAGVTLEDLARASASFQDGDELAAFDTARDRGELTSGPYVEHMVFIERLFMRATTYAQERSERLSLQR